MVLFNINFSVSEEQDLLSCPAEAKEKGRSCTLNITSSAETNVGSTILSSLENLDLSVYNLESDIFVRNALFIMEGPRKFLDSY